MTHIFPLTIRHYFPFAGDQVGSAGLSGAGAWDQLRLRQADDPFTLPENSADWLDRCSRNQALRGRAAELASCLRSAEVRMLFSVGAGIACLELLLLSEYPELELDVTDFAPGCVDLLRKHFAGRAKVDRFDFANEPFAKARGKAVLLNRVDSELSDSQWSKVSSALFESGVPLIFFIPTAVMGARSYTWQVYQRMRRLIASRPPRWAGYMRNRAALKRLLARHYRLQRVAAAGGSEIWIWQRQLSA